MNCNCKSDIEARLLERFKGSAPTGQNHGVTISGYGFCIEGNTMTQRPYAEVTQSADMPKKSGGWTHKRSKLSMYFSYCPYCGAPVADQPPAATSTKDAEVFLKPMDTGSKSVVFRPTATGEAMEVSDSHGASDTLYRHLVRPEGWFYWHPSYWAGFSERKDREGRLWAAYGGPRHVIDDFGTLVPVEGGVA